MAHDIFISYSSKDKTIADTVCAKLEERRIRCWIAPRDIPAGQNFARSIISAINACKVFVLVWSASTNTSEHILNEINQAFDQGIPIIPFRIQDVQPTLEMRYYFGRTHWLDALTPPLEKHIGTLAETIHAFLDKKSEVTPEPIPVKAEGTGEETKQEEIKPLIKTDVKLEPVPDGEQVIETSPKPGSVPRAAMKRDIPEVHPKGVPPPTKRVLISVLAGVLVVAALVTMYFLGVFKGPSTTVKTKGPGQSDPPASVIATPSPTTEMTKTALMSTPTDTPEATTPSVTPLPDWVNGLPGQVMTAIKFREPDFQDDFSFWKLDWEFTDRWTECPNTYARIIKEELRLISDSGCWAWADLPRLDLHNYATQVDMNFQGKNTWGAIVIKGATQGEDFSFYLDFDGQWNADICQEGSCRHTKSGSISIDPKNPITVTIISSGLEKAVYVNALPVFYFKYSGLALSTASHYSLTVQAESDQPPNTVEFDNLKIWNLEKIENLSTLTP